ncbi:DUF4349 domain-containing protein [Plantibacter flavus]|uniref:DUF4349 domain-containing protein n=1 Tax=Plantibacter flavus TaxID=150123 RepID=UPI0010C1C57B|nr:DUF4349 domain-containing protein [Plantibacter flavus]TKJ98749.1 DUF4349 domain-containing protein [Plantibacter flavus]
MTRSAVTRTTTVFVSAVLVGLVLSGCSAGSSTEAGSDSRAAMPAPGQVAGDAQVGVGGAASPDLTQQQVVTTGSLTVTADDPISTATDATRIVTEAGGRVDSRDETPGTSDQAAQATLTVRIPADDFDDVLAQLQALGTVNNLSVSAVDVTAQAADLDARVTALQASVDRLLGLMAASTTTADLLAAETSLSQRQAELDGLVAQRDALADQVDFSSVFVSFVAPGSVAPGAPTDFWGGVVAGWNALAAAAAGLVVVVGVLVPWLLPLAVVAAVVVLLVRSGRRRAARRSQTPATSAGPDATMDR